MPLLFGFGKKKKIIDNRITNKFAITLADGETLHINPENGTELPLKTLEFKKGLGHGAFGGVSLCSTSEEEGNEQYALKTIDMSHTAGDPALRHAFMRLVKREVSALKKLGMLKGFRQDGDKIYILMPFIPGKTLTEVLSTQEYRNDRRKSAEMINKCLKALQELHDQGIAHMDSHASNLIIGDDGKITPIDFGLSVETHDDAFFSGDADKLMLGPRMMRIQENNIFEILFFMKIDQALWRIYMEETLQHIKDHKIETALKVLTYGIVSIAAVHGLATYQVARIMAWSLTRMLANEYLVGKLSVLLKAFEGARGFPDIHVNGVNIGRINRILGRILSRILPLALLADISANIYKNRESVDLLYQIVVAAIKGDPGAVYKIIKKIDIEKGFNAMLLYFPLKRIPGFCSNVVEEHLTSTESLENQCDKIASAAPRI